MHKRRHVALIRELDRFRLTASALPALGKRLIEVTVWLKPCRHLYGYSRLSNYPPAYRRLKVDEWYQTKYQKVVKSFPADSVSRLSSFRRPTHFRARLNARDVTRIARIPEVESIDIDSIRGRRRGEPKKLKPELGLYAVKARFGIQVEGQKRGMQTYEDRIVAVRAWNGEDAEKRLRKEFEAYGSPYMNSHGYMVRWQFEKVLDVYHMSEAEFDPKGTEVFSELRDRRMRSEHQWQPFIRKRRR